MCGIIGINSNKEVTSTILNSLRKLEYRGYDSAGIATLNSGYIQEVKCEGRVDNLEKNIIKNKLPFDLLSIELRDGIQNLSKITGQELTEELLNNIFSKFCIGK